MAEENLYNYSKDFRLRSKADFYYLKKGSKKFSTKNILIYFKKSKLNLDHSRIGISVTKKVGNAVVRNKFKRNIRDAYRKSDLKLLNKDFLVIVSNNILKNNTLNNAVFLVKKDLLSASEFLK